MSIRSLMVTAAGGLVIALAPVPLSQLQAQGTPNDADIKLITDVTSDNLAEMQFGQLAGTKATNAGVKQFAQQMVRDHNNLQSQWIAAAQSSGLFFSPALAPQHQQELTQLKALSGPDFDRTYMATMIQNHQNAVYELQSQGQSAQSARVRQLVTSTLPIIQQHLTLAQQIGSQVGAQTVASAGHPVTGPVTNPGTTVTNPATTTTTNPSTNPTTTANGQVTTQGAQVSRPGNVRADAKLIQEVLADNMLEGELGKLAEQKASKPAVKQFAQREESDHNSLQSDWVGTASNNGLPMKPGMGRNHRAKLTQLQKVSRNNFDRAYMQMEIQNHLDYMEPQVVHTSQVRDLLNRYVQVVQRHSIQAKQVGAQVGADTTVTVRSERKTKKK